MAQALKLEEYLDFIKADKPALAPVCTTVLAIAEAGRLIRRILARGPLAGELSALVGESRDGDGQKVLDVMTNDILRDALATSPVAAFASEESDDVEILDLHAKLAVALDPLDGSTNIDTLAPLGTIFSILPAAGVPADSFLQTGRHQLAAGFLIYGPRTALVITLGEGTRIFTLDPESGAYVATSGDIKIPRTTREYAINSSNQRHWEPQIRGYVNELVMGRGGPRGEDFNTRWLAAVVGDAYRILIRGGVYLYPGDYRRGYQAGRLRLVYEANPIAMIMENAEGAATDGRIPVLDVVPTSLHQNCPLVFGSCDEVLRVAQAYDAEVAADSPLFKTRSLFRKPVTSGGTLA